MIDQFARIGAATAAFHVSMPLSRVRSTANAGSDVVIVVIVFQ